jgi:hypothetical protein
LVETEGYVCGAGIETWDWDDDVSMGASFYRDGQLVGTQYAFGPSPHVYISTTVERSDRPVELECEMWGSGFNLSAHYTVEPIPTGEDTIPMGWYWGETQHMFDQVLSGSGPFIGRRVKEEDGGGGYDFCWYQNSPFRKLDAVTGGWWPVGAGNMWGSDIVGFGSALVAWYRTHSVMPCSCLMVQRMWIKTQTPRGDDEWHWYTTNELRAGITSDKAWAERDSVRVERTWQ